MKGQSALSLNMPIEWKDRLSRLADQRSGGNVSALVRLLVLQAESATPALANENEMLRDLLENGASADEAGATLARIIKERSER